MNALSRILKGTIPAIAYRKLSLRARVAVALVCVERFCRAKDLRHPLMRSFLEHMWELPCMTSLPEWESFNCELVHAGLGDPFPSAILEALKVSEIQEEDFRRLLENCVEIIYSSAYAASDNTGSLRSLGQVLCVVSGAGVQPPPVQPFLISLFADGHGWGRALSAELRDGWRYRAYELSATPK